MAKCPRVEDRLSSFMMKSGFSFLNNCLKLFWISYSPTIFKCKCAEKNEIEYMLYFSGEHKAPPVPNLLHYGVQSEPNRRFVWNSYLLSKVENELHPDWILYIMHGFISQSNVSIFGRSVYIAVIARRSNKYAGTRFLKRGANFDVR